MSKKTYIKYPCPVVVGDVLQFADGTEREIYAISGKYLHFSDGTQFRKYNELLENKIVFEAEKKSGKKTAAEPVAESEPIIEPGAEETQEG